jgi:hypothetical protein
MWNFYSQILSSFWDIEVETCGRGLIRAGPNTVPQLGKYEITFLTNTSKLKQSDANLELQFVYVYLVIQNFLTSPNVFLSRV